MGRPEFQQIVAQVPAEKIVNTNYNRTSTVAKNGGSEVIDIYSAPNTMSNIVTMYYHCPAPIGATTGNHMMYMDANPSFIKWLKGTSSYNKIIEFLYNHFTTADIEQEPATEIGQVQTMQTILFDETNGIRCVYTNNTDVDQTGERDFFFYLSQRAVGGAD